MYLFGEKEASTIGASMFPREMLLQISLRHRFATDDAIMGRDSRARAPASFPMTFRTEFAAVFAKPVFFVNVGHQAR